MATRVGSVAGLWRFPVKSMQGERIAEADLSATGIFGDRAFALIDAATGKVVSAKSVKLFPGLLNCRAAFVDLPRPGRDLPPVRITLPTGQAVTGDSPEANRILSAHFGREVTLARSAPPDFTIDQYHPDVAGADPGGYRDVSVEQKLGAALFAQLGAPSPVPVGAFFDVFPLSVLTTSTLARFAELAPDSRFDERRFRMNVIVDTAEAGFLENTWVGRALSVGHAARLHVAMPDPRCVMTTLAHDDLPNDTGVLRAAVTHNCLPLFGGALFPCVGVYASVEAAGALAVGDPVELQ